MDLRNPADCLLLLQRLRPMDVVETQAILLELLTTLPASEAPASERLHVLESAREILHFVQGEAAKRYASNPLPPDHRDNALLLQVVRVWQAAAAVYAHLGNGAAADAMLPADFNALIAQRRVLYTGNAILEYFRAHRALPAGLWSALHEAYLAAEVQGVARQRVADPTNPVWTAQSPSEAYISLLLLDLANPYGRSPHELIWVSRWAQRFAPYSGMHLGNDDGTSSQYGLDLASDHGLRPLNLLAPSPSLRRLDGSRIAGQIETAINQFKRGATPASLGLGEDCPVEAGGRLLLWLYRPWGLAAAGRKFPRRPSQGRAQLTIQREATVFFINRGPFRQPHVVEQKIHSLKSDMSLLTFGERVADAADGCSVSEQAELKGLHMEPWEILDQSVGGFRLSGRPRREKLSHHQLVGLRPPDGADFLLAHVSWQMYREDGVMEAGVQMLPGIPRVVGVRQLGHGLDGKDTEYQPAFLLPALSALKIAQSIVLPSGWFQPGRMLQVYDEREREIRLGEALLRGATFDQVSYVEGK